MKDLIDVHTFGLWGPTFLHLRHGVPLGRVGAFLLFPSLCSIFGKVFQAPFESRLTRRGVALVRIRKMSTAIACATQLMCEPPPLLLPRVLTSESDDCWLWGQIRCAVRGGAERGPRDGGLLPPYPR